uniref:Uncharacterized protein n=1 Tax=Anguilla anguilla TaxID=7936 RepID=A0A0E9U2Q8_ANGAN
MMRKHGHRLLYKCFLPQTKIIQSLHACFPFLKLMLNLINFTFVLQSTSLGLFFFSTNESNT